MAETCQLHSACGCCLQLPEYYLTAVEADILAACGHDIVQSCVAQQGALLVELGAG
jgi:uncharacterized SAM-dependent methyltransferase